jgi:hypothetical protein
MIDVIAQQSRWQLLQDNVLVLAGTNMNSNHFALHDTTPSA